MEATKTHQGKTYAFDATAQGKGLWKQLTKAGKLGKIASKELQNLWGNPNDTNQSPQPSGESNVIKFGGMIKEKAPTPARLKTFRSMLTDPNETVGSAAIKGLKQRLRPEILVKNLFGRTAGLMAAKGLGVSSERMDAVARGFSDTTQYKDESGFSGRTKGKSIETPKEVVQELELIRIKNEQVFNEIKQINDYFKDKAKKEDIAGDKRAMPTKMVSSSTGGAPATVAPIESAGLFDGILGMFGGAMAGGGLAKVFTKIWGTLKNVLKKAVTKIPIVGALILAAFGFKDAYDEYVESGDFSSAVGQFFESVADNLTFGLSTSLLGKDGIKNFVKGIIDDTTEMFTKFFDSANEWLDEYIITPAGEMWETIKTSIGDFDLSETITKISETISSAFESIKTFFDESVITPASTMWEKIKESLPEFKIDEIIDTLKTKFSNAIASVKNFLLDDLITPISSVPGKIVGTLKSIVASLFEKIGEFELKLPEFSIKNPITGSEYKLGGQSFKPFANLLDFAKNMRDAGAQEVNPTTPASAPSIPPPVVSPQQPTAAPVTAVPIQPAPPNADSRNIPPTGYPQPQQRTTGSAVQQSTQNLEDTQNAARNPSSPVVVNNTTNNNNMNGSGGNRGPVAPVRNEDPSMQRAMMDMALSSAF